MTFKLDENLPVDAAALLRRAGLKGNPVRDQGLRGADDEVVAAAAQREDRVLITLDLDFSNIQAYPPHLYPGIVVLRARKQDKRTVLALLQSVRRVLSKQSPAGQLWMVESDRIRFRHG